MTKFHMSDDGPRPCSASVKACPVGGEHGTQEEIQASYDKKMNEAHAIPRMTRNSSPEKEARKMFNAKTKYGDGNEVAIRRAFEAFKATEDNGGGIEIEEDDNYAYAAVAFYDRNRDLDSDDREALGFERSDTVRPFVSMSSKRNIVWMTPGIEVNGEKKYDDTYRYELEDGSDLRKIFDISQEHVDSLTYGALESETEVASGLYDEPSKNVQHVSDKVKDLRVRLM